MMIFIHLGKNSGVFNMISESIGGKKGIMIPLFSNGSYLFQNSGYWCPNCNAMSSDFTIDGDIYCKICKIVFTDLDTEKYRDFH